MFSRKHPYLFFVLIFSSVVLCSFTVMSVFFYFGANSSEFELRGKDKVGIIEITGVIADSKKILMDLKNFAKNDTIKSIVLRINSPGGGVGPSQEIFREINKIKVRKKIIVSMGAVAASGGYYIAAAADGIVANPGTITGSIGVIMGYTNFRELIDKIGLKPVVIKSGKYKDMGSPVREMSEAEKKVLQDFVDKVHMQFVKDVASGRKLDINKVKTIANGSIYSGEDAKAYGLIDRLGNLEDAIEWAGRLGGIKGEVLSVYPKEESSLLIKKLLMESAVNLMERIFLIIQNSDNLSISCISSQGEF